MHMHSHQPGILLTGGANRLCNLDEAFGRRRSNHEDASKQLHVATMRNAFECRQERKTE